MADSVTPISADGWTPVSKTAPNTAPVSAEGWTPVNSKRLPAKPIEIAKAQTTEEVARPKDSILASAGKDIVNVIGGTSEMLGRGVLDFVNILHPDPKKNTAFKIGKALYDEYQAGDLAETEFRAAMGIIKPIIEDMGAIAKPIMQGDFMEAAETVARKPATYAMDIATLAQPARAVSRGAASIAFGPSTEAISQRIARGASVKSARPYAEIAQDVPEAMGTLENKIGTAAKTAIDTLSDKPKMGYPSAKIVDIMDKAKQNIGVVVSDADVAAVDAIDRYAKRIKKGYKNENISPQDVKKTIQKLDADIDWSTPKSDTTNRAIKDIRRNIDEVLKKDNSEYEQVMKPLADLMDLRADIQQNLGIKKIGGDYNVPDSFSRKLAQVNDPRFKPQTREVLTRLGNETGFDFMGEAQDFRIRELFDRSYPQGSSRTNLGATVGGAIGGVASGIPGAGIGASVGGAAGQVLDRFGGRMLGSAIDVASPALRAASALPDAIPGAATGAVLAGQMGRAQEIKNQYKSGKLSREEAAKQLRATGAFK
jgi:hypothetical protein